MKELFLTNTSTITFLSKIKSSLAKCKSFYFSVSFIKRAGLVLIIQNIERALKRGVKGLIVTSAYQNFTDGESLRLFFELANKYPSFECRFEWNYLIEDDWCHADRMIVQKLKPPL